MLCMKPDYQTDDRMEQKLRAIPLPDFKNKSVLDIGCDMGFWSFLAAKRCAGSVLGIDRNREVKQEDGSRKLVDLIALNNKLAKEKQEPCEFRQMDMGKQWHELDKKFDVIFCFSMYHHWFENCGDHLPIWFWLARHSHMGTEILWENPVDCADRVVQMNVGPENQKKYTREDIMNAALHYFVIEHIGPALHEPHREVWRLKLRGSPLGFHYSAEATGGSGGATKAWQHENGRRIKEVEHILGMRCPPGSFNLRVKPEFRWFINYYRAQVLDVVERGKGLEVEWKPRWARFYPCIMENAAHKRCFAFTFEGEKYPLDFVELIGDRLLRQDGKFLLWA